MIDIAGYDFEATATEVAFDGTYGSNLASPTAAITDLFATSAVWNTGSGSFDLNFGDGNTNDIDIYNGEGIDLSIFIADPTRHDVTISLFANTTLLGTQTLNTASYTGSCIPGTGGGCGSDSVPIYVMDVDFGLFGESIDAVDTVRLDVSGLSAVPSLAGAYYTSSSAAVVPVPPAMVLFLSGLTGFGLLARRRRSH